MNIHTGINACPHADLRTYICACLGVVSRSPTPVTNLRRGLVAGPLSQAFVRHLCRVLQSLVGLPRGEFVARHPDSVTSLVAKDRPGLYKRSASGPQPHGYIHTYIHACIRTYIHTYVHTYITYIHTTKQNENIHTYLHAYVHTYMRTTIHVCMHACMHACMHTHEKYHTHRNIHTYNMGVRTCINTYAVRTFAREDGNQCTEAVHS